jgi:hypothetical protein
MKIVRDIRCPEWVVSWFFSLPLDNCRIVPRLCHDRFLPNPFHSIFHLSPYHSTLCSLDSDSVPQKHLKLPLYSNKLRAVKTYVVVEVQLHAFVISALAGGEWLASLTGGWAPVELSGPQTLWKTLASTRNMIASSRSCNPQPSHYTDWAISTPQLITAPVLERNVNGIPSFFLSGPNYTERRRKRDNIKKGEEARETRS